MLSLAGKGKEVLGYGRGYVSIYLLISLISCILFFLSISDLAQLGSIVPTYCYGVGCRLQT